jgi:hypothetical protein
MIKPPDSVKRYTSAKHRFLKEGIMGFFRRELPRFFGPALREKIADELVKMVAQMMPEKDHVKPGQVVWNALDAKTRGDSPNRRYVPVILTLIDQQDCHRLASGTAMSQIAEEATARIIQEAFRQGALLSMRDIGLLTWRATPLVSKYRLNYERKHRTTLPHTGTLHDMGSCISHKRMILEKILSEKKDPTTVAAETKHSLAAVERYLTDYRRVEMCYNQNPDPSFISLATGLAKFVVASYIEIINELKQNDQ